MKDIVIIANFCRDFSDTDNGRFMYLCKGLSRNNNVEIITSDFRHLAKTHKDPLEHSWPFKITFLHEIGYKRNISIQRFMSHFMWGKEVKKYLLRRKKPDIIYCAVPSLTAPYVSAKFCNKHDIKFIIDIQDLWPEAFQMVFNVPILKNIIFAPFTYLANSTYKQADEICAVSQKYVDRALSVNSKCNKGHVVYLGTSIQTFDDAVKNTVPKIKKNNKEDIWLGYCGSLSDSYDIPCVISSLKILKEKGIKPPKFIIMGDGGKRKEFEVLARDADIDAVFLGKLPYDEMCAQLVQCDVVVNPIVKGSAASIINKHGDYASSGLPVINTQESIEYRNLVDTYHMGMNCNNGDAIDLADKIEILINNKGIRINMGKNARICALERFDRTNSYDELFDLIND